MPEFDSGETSAVLAVSKGASPELGSGACVARGEEEVRVLGFPQDESAVNWRERSARSKPELVRVYPAQSKPELVPMASLFLATSRQKVYAVFLAPRTRRAHELSVTIH